MPKIRKIALRRGTIRDGLIACRDSMLPQELANDPLTAWIIHSDTLDRPPEEDAVQKFQESRFKSTGPVKPFIGGTVIADPSLLGLFHGAVLQETYGFFFAALFHIGRILETSKISRQKIERLRQGVNLDRSVEALAARLQGQRPDLLAAIEKLCRSQADFHSFRSESALNAWHLWQRCTVALQHLAYLSEVPQDNKHSRAWWLKLGPASDPEKRALGWSDLTPISFGLCSHLTTTFLIQGIAGDRGQFRSVSFANLGRILDGIAAHPDTFYKTVTAISFSEYPNIIAGLIGLANSLIPVGHRKALEWTKSISAIKTAERSQYDQELNKKYESLQEAIHSRRSSAKEGDDKPHSARIPLVSMPVQGRNVMERTTKLYIVSGSQPPIWPNVKVLANEFWVLSALNDAGVGLRTLVDTFAADLIAFNALLGKESHPPTPYIPFGDSEWSVHLNAFFNDVWISGLSTKWSRLAFLSGEQFSRFVTAAAALLSAMGYTINPMLGGSVPPGTREEKPDTDPYKSTKNQGRPRA